MSEDSRVRWDKWVAIISLLTLLMGVSAWAYTHIWGSAEDHSALTQAQKDIARNQTDIATDHQLILDTAKAASRYADEADNISALQHDDNAYQQKLQDILDRLTVIETKMIFILDQGTDRRGAQNR